MNENPTYTFHARVFDVGSMYVINGGQISKLVGYVGPAQFSRDLKQHFRRTAAEEVKWARQHLGEMVSDQ